MRYQLLNIQVHINFGVAVIEIMQVNVYLLSKFCFSCLTFPFPTRQHNISITLNQILSSRPIGKFLNLYCKNTSKKNLFIPFLCEGKKRHKNDYILSQSIFLYVRITSSYEKRQRGLCIIIKLIFFPLKQRLSKEYFITSDIGGIITS